MFQVPAIAIRQRGVALLVTALPFSVLRKHIRVDLYSPDNEGYQRPLVDRRLAGIAKYMIEGDGTLPTSILLCVRHGDSNPPSFEAESELGNFAEAGVLQIPEDATLWMVDGQHRHFGVEHAYTRKDASELIDYPFPVTVMMEVDRYTEMRHFSTINTEQRKMPTDIVDRHMVIRADREGLGMIASGGRGEREYLRAKATRISDALNEKPGSWYHQIAIPGVQGRDKGLVRQHAIVASLTPHLKDALLSGFTEQDLTELLARYWQAMASVWSEAFADPGSYRVQATVGVYALHMVFPTLVQFCTAAGDLSENKMREVWQGTGVAAKFWHKEDGDPLTLGTGMASIRAVAQYLREQLPSRTVVTV